MATVKIIDVRHFPSSDPKRAGQLDTIVTYQLDALRTYPVIIPSADPTEVEIKTAIQKSMTTIGKWVDKEMQIP